jgi:hypothetical protein
MDKLDKTSPDFVSNALRIQSDFQESDGWESVMNSETASSFLEFCIGIKGDANYWEKVFERLKLGWETDDGYEKINYEIKKEQAKEKPIKERFANKSDLQFTAQESKEIWDYTLKEYLTKKQ